MIRQGIATRSFILTRYHGWGTCFWHRDLVKRPRMFCCKQNYLSKQRKEFIMRGTKKYKIVKCFRHFGAIIILLWLISIVRFPYSFDKLQVLSNKNFESVSNSVLTLVDCKSTESKSSIDFLLTDGKQYYIITAKRFFIGNRYDLSQLMPFSEGTSYSYTDCFTKVNVIQSGNKLCLDEERYVQPYILSFLFLCVVLMLNILGDKSTPEE